MTERENKPESLVINFAEGLLEPTLLGEKKITLRKYRPEAHQLKEGQLFVGRFQDGFDVLLRAKSDTEIKTFGDLTDEEAQQDGFLNAKNALSEMRSYYPELTKETPLGIIRYEVVRRNNRAIVSTNTQKKD